MDNGATLTIAAGKPLSVDTVLAEESVRGLLKAFGMEQHEEIMRNTPRRVVDAYVQLFTPPAFEPTIFPNLEKYDEMVLVRGIRFRSICEHHFLPFTGEAHVGYIPGGDVVGISKLARVVQTFAGRPQRQERLTVEIADWLTEQLNPVGAGVVLSAEHTCMTLRGVRADGATTVTSAFRGALADDRERRNEFLAMSDLGARRSTA